MTAGRPFVRIGDAIYNLDGLPFRSFGLAARMRELLNGETGADYGVESHPAGGFIVRRDAQGLAASAAKTPPMAESPEPALLPQRRVVYRLRPAVFRANLLWLPLLGGGLGLVFAPQLLMGALLAMGDSSPNLWGSGFSHVLGALKLSGGFLTGAMALWLGTEWLSAVYTVSGTGIEVREGLVARDTIGLRFQDIRSVSLKQTLGERLLNIGTLEFSSAGTDGVPVRFFDIARPARIKALIQARLNAFDVED